MKKLGFLLALAAMILAPAAVMAASTGPSELFAMARDPFISKALYGNQHRLVGDLAPDGAVGVNAEWESGQRSQYYIEEQRYCGDLVQAGVARHRNDFIDAGIKVMQWGFNHQAADGSFPGTGDPFHSVSLFVEASARALLMLREYNDAAYNPVIDQYEPKVLLSAHWLTEPDVERAGKGHDRPYAHRRWILATALAEAASLNDDRDLWRKSEEYARDGIAQQDPATGIDPEKSGYDVSYQVLGLMLACRYYMLSHNDSLKAQIAQFVDRGMNWELSRIDATGAVNMIGSSRTLTEAARSGKAKTLDFRSLVQGLVYATEVTGDPKFRAVAESVVAAHG